MITNLGLATVWVLDQESAKKFFTDKLGLEVRDDLTLGEGGMRWVTVGAKGQPELSLALMVPGPPTMDPDSAAQMRALIAKGVLGAGAFNTDDCQAEYERLSAKGVEFVHPPQKRPTGSRRYSGTTPAAGTASPSPSTSSTRPCPGAADPARRRRAPSDPGRADQPVRRAPSSRSTSTSRSTSDFVVRQLSGAGRNTVMPR